MSHGSQASQNGPNRALYSHNTAGHNVHQHVGPYVQGGILTAASQFSSIEPRHEGNRKYGYGTQVQGLTYEPPKGLGRTLGFVPTAPGEWSGNIHEGTGHAYGHGNGESMQILGTYVVN